MRRTGYDSRSIAAENFLPLDGAIIRLNISSAGETVAFLETDAPGRLRFAQTPDVLRSVFPEIFGEKESTIRRLVNRFLTKSSEAWVIPIGFVRSGDLADALMRFQVHGDDPSWRIVVGFVPEGFRLYGRPSESGAEILLQDGRGRPVDVVYRVTHEHITKWDDVASALRQWPGV